VYIDCFETMDSRKNGSGWGAQSTSVDESEDDEVQGILNPQMYSSIIYGTQMPHFPGYGGTPDMFQQQKEQSQQQPAPPPPPPPQQQPYAGFGGGLIAGAGTVFAPPGYQQHEAPPRPSQLNAHVAAFMPSQQQQQQPWQHGDMDRSQHRTPGPARNTGPSPPNPFRYGMGFDYRAHGMGVSPPHFNLTPTPDDMQQQQVQGASAGGDSFATNFYAGSWYEQGSQQPSQGHSEFGSGSSFPNYGGYGIPAQEEMAVQALGSQFHNTLKFDGESNDSYLPEQQFYFPQNQQEQQQQQQETFQFPDEPRQESTRYSQQQQQPAVGSAHSTPSNHPLSPQIRPQPIRLDAQLSPEQKSPQRGSFAAALSSSASSGGSNYAQIVRKGASSHEEEERKDTYASINSVAPKVVHHHHHHYHQRRSSTGLESRSSASSMDSSAPMHAHKKRADLEESPQTRSLFKDFYKTFRLKEKESYESAVEYAKRVLQDPEVPEKIHYKIYLEMADLAKRENKFEKARELYQHVNSKQPYAYQGWLEYAKMEEECGHLFECQHILHKGLEFCTDEQLLTKAIKHEERLGHLDVARHLLSPTRTQSIEKTWRTVLEGALMEARAGNTAVARKVFKFLMAKVPWYGPIYFEATKFEEKNEEFDRAIDIVEKGLKAIPRYGPLWFNAFRLYEKVEMEDAIQALGNDFMRREMVMMRYPDDRGKYDLFQMFGVRNRMFQSRFVPCELRNTRGALQRAMHCISKELVWKVHFEAAQVAERGGGNAALKRARHAYVQSILRCPVNLRWKVWIAGARAELAHGHPDKAARLLDRAMLDVPAKSKSQVYLEQSRLHELTGNVEQSRKILQEARKETSHEWKVFLESIMLELRNGNRNAALRAAEEALKVHHGTGRLWAISVQLKHVIGPDSQRLVFREALKACPKSGEVWCEGARLHLNPLSPYMDLETAARYLDLAIQFTPQYGGSFLELLRLRLLWTNFGDESQFPDFRIIEDEQKFRQAMLDCNTSEIELRCVNADPNYGALWFHCKRGLFDTARQVLRTAKSLMIEELTKFRYVYREAIVESIYRKQEEEEKNSFSKARTTPALATGENKWLWDRVRHVHGAEECANFSTALLSVNWLGEHVNLLVDAERRKFLFGSDQIVP